jgi:hypothetical protein
LTACTALSARETAPDGGERLGLGSGQSLDAGGLQGAQKVPGRALVGLRVAAVGKATEAGIERRYLLVVEHAQTEILVADPAGYGLAIIANGELLEWCKLGSKRGIPWVGLVGTISE